jgi:hypothetical protein
MERTMILAQAKTEKQTTSHRLINGNTRSLSFIPDESVHLVVTSPPYWTVKRYNENPAQLGHIADYEHFLSELSKVWKEVYRVLVPEAGSSDSWAMSACPEVNTEGIWCCPFMRI